jgi:putative nucleotidyltransferase with HDIG domain
VERVERAFSKATTVIKNMNKNIFSRPAETLEEMGLLVGEMVDAFLDSPEATLHVMGEKAGNEDVYFHSLNVAILAMMLAKEIGLSPDEAREMCVGALLHDIGLNDIPDRVVKKPAAEATKAERNFRATHVELGVAIGKRAGLSAQALSVLAQHHEFIDGSGYPKGLKLEAISPSARLVSLVNFYDNLCNPADVSKALTPHEALSYMFSHCRPKFEIRALQMLIRSLGVHPPGSVVQLSNESFAVVTSVNPKKPLRPWVILYDESVPKEEAIMVSLEVETDLQILKSIRPSLLSPKIAAYLNPRKRVTYFFDGGSSAPKGTAS